MSHLAYLVLALLAGGAAGTGLAYLLNAPRKKVSETRQWLSLAITMVVVISCAVFMKELGDAAALAFATKAAAALAFAISFVAAFLRCKVKL